MKKYIYLIFFICLIQSCSFKQEIEFRKDGTIDYNLVIDAHKALHFDSKSSEERKYLQIVKDIFEVKGSKYDTTFMFTHLVDTARIEREYERKMLKNLENLKVKVHYDNYFPTLRFHISGEFKNVKELNDAFSSLVPIYPFLTNYKKPDESVFSKFFEQYITYNWNGDQLEVKSIPIPWLGKESDEKSYQYYSMVEAIRGTRLRTKYTFPEKIRHTVSPDVTYENNRHTAVLDYPLLNVLYRPDLINIHINRPPDISVSFRKNSAKVESDQEMNIYNASEYLKRNPHLYVLVVGSADKETGTPEINEKLADERSYNVHQLLTNKYGIKPERTYFYSETDPPLNKDAKWNRITGIYFYKPAR